MKDVQQVPVPNVVGGANEFLQGKADAFMFAVGAGKVAEVNAKKPVRVLPVDHSKEAMARLRKFIPVAYATILKPGKGRAGVDQPTWVYAYDYLVLANDKVPDDVVYKLTKLLHDHKKELAANFGALSRLQSQAHEQGHGPGEIPSGRDQVLQGNRRMAAEERQLIAPAAFRPWL